MQYAFKTSGNWVQTVLSVSEAPILRVSPPTMLTKRPTLPINDRGTDPNRTHWRQAVYLFAPLPINMRWDFELSTVSNWAAAALNLKYYHQSDPITSTNIWPIDKKLKTCTEIREPEVGLIINLADQQAAFRPLLTSQALGENSKSGYCIPKLQHGTIIRHFTSYRVQYDRMTRQLVDPYNNITEEKGIKMISSADMLDSSLDGACSPRNAFLNRVLNFQNTYIHWVGSLNN